MARGSFSVIIVICQKKEFAIMRVSKFTKQNDEQAYIEFLSNYPYDNDRKQYVQSLMQRYEAKLTRFYDNMIKEAVLKEPNTQYFIYYRIWAFSVCDMVVEYMAETHNINEKEVIDIVLKSLKEKKED